MVRRALSGILARRRPDYIVSAVPNTASGISIPAPVGGWNAISPLADMPEKDAVTLKNAFPQPGYIEIRKGHKAHNIVGGSPVESLLPYHGLSSTSDKLFAACTSSISDVTTFTTASASSTASVAVSGLSNARWQHLQVTTPGGNFLWICNGSDKPRTYSGAAWATAEITGITATSPIQAALHKGRIWMALVDQINPAYLNTNAIQGTATPFDLSAVMRKGGFLQAVGSWSLDSGAGPDDYIAFLSSRGEVAVYAGTDPNTNFVLRGVYEMGPPIGRRCLVKVGADLVAVCQDGLLPLSQALVTDRAAAITASITKKIQPVMNESARLYKDNFGWQLIAYPRGTRAILNVPITEGDEQEQYVMNVVTGAWCRFTGENANCWAVFKDRLFYGGNAGRVYEADCQGFDEGAAIELDVETAFNYCKSRGRLKQFTLSRTLLSTDGKIVPGVALNVDFSRNATVLPDFLIVQNFAQWDVASWDVGLWGDASHIVTDWQAVAGIGFCASIRIKASIQAQISAIEAQSLILQINGWDLQFIQGAFM